jgi:hypothetical protein
LERKRQLAREASRREELRLLEIRRAEEARRREDDRLLEARRAEEARREQARRDAFNQERARAKL